MRFCLNSLVFSLLCVFAAATYAESESLPLPPSRAVTSLPESNAENNAKNNSQGLPLFISAEQLQGNIDSQFEASGKVELRQDEQAIFADHLLYRQDSRDLVAEGNVRLEQSGNVITGPMLKLNLDTDVGKMTQPEYQIGINRAHGSADTLNIESRQNYTLHNANYTTCPAGNDDWLLKMGMLEIDRNRQVGIALHARVEFMGVPILYTPWMDFSLSGQRKTGFLGPTFGSTGTGGSEITLPFFWNIAPNRDATIVPRVMVKRGTMLENEFRYLEKNFSGEAHLDVLPDDKLTHTSRTRAALKHTHDLGSGWAGSTDLNYASDDAYFRDLSGALSSTSQTNLVREAMLTYGDTWWNAAIRAQRFQTLQDPVVPVTVPYRRTPQITLGAHRVLSGANVAVVGEYVDFRHPTAISGQRLVAYPSVSYPLVAKPAFYVTPKFGVHKTAYRLRENNLVGQTNSERTTPIFSLDSGAVMEREWSSSEQGYVQTLEPRAFYVHSPYRDQSALPNFDSAQADFSFAQMFTENRFFGNDRIGDADHVTLALTSRLLAHDSGAERLRVAIGQRYSLKAPRVNLNTPSATTNKSDFLLAASGKLTRTWSLDSALQYNPNQSQIEKFNFAGRYQPESGKVLNLGYRYTRNSLRQVDVSTQWPLHGRWQGVARWNYSLRDQHMLEALVGLEYNQSCWALRLVAQRFVTATNEVSRGIFIQLELTDLVRLGHGDPLDVLKQSVPGYSESNTFSSGSSN